MDELVAKNSRNLSCCSDIKYLMLFFVINLCLIHPQHVNAQAYIKLEGRVLSALTKKPIPYANIKHDTDGVFTNNDGKFRFSFLKDSLTPSDTLYISSIGYRTSKVLLDTIKGDYNYTIWMKEDILKLDEIVIKGKKEKLNVVDVVNEAIKNIENNSYSGEYGLEAFYRQTHYFTNVVSGEINYLRYMEAAVLLQNGERGYKSFVKEVRRSNDFRTSNQNLYKGDEEDERFKFEDYFLKLDCSKPLERSNTRIYNSAFSLLDPILSNLNNDFVYRHKFKLDSIANLDGELVYVIKILPSKNSTLINLGGSSNILLPIGRLVIAAKDYSILEFQYSYIINPKKKANTYVKLIKIISQGNVLFNDVVRFKKNNGKLYLSYLMRDQGDTLFMGGYKSSGLMRAKVSARDEIDNGYFRIRRELVVTKFINSSQLNEEGLHANYKSVFPKSYLYDRKFWNRYNLLSNTKAETKLLKDLGKGIPIEQQFEQNGK